MTFKSKARKVVGFREVGLLLEQMMFLRLIHGNNARDTGFDSMTWSGMRAGEMIEIALYFRISSDVIEIARVRRSL